MSSFVSAAAVLLPSAALLVGVDAFSKPSIASCEYLDKCIDRTLHSRHQLIFPIKPQTESYNGGVAKTEIDIGNSLSSAFNDLVDSSDFMETSPSRPPSGHRISSCDMPCFGDDATVTFAPRQSTCDENGDPTEYILSALNFGEPVSDFGNLCLEIYKYRDDIKGVVSIGNLKESVLTHLNSLPPEPGFDADLTSSEAIGNPELGSLIDRVVDLEALRKLFEEGFVVIDNVMKTSQSSHDKLDEWMACKKKSSQVYCRTDTVSFLNKRDAKRCGVADQYDLLLALASHLNDKLDFYDSPYEPVFPGTVDRPLTNPINSKVQMAEYGCKDFYLPHSDNSIDSDSINGNGYPKRRSNYRYLTAILYTNEGWEVADGGQLRMYLDTQLTENHEIHDSQFVENHDYVDINPSNGKLLLFDSRLVHSVEEVTHQSKIRRALTLWINRPEESGVTCSSAKAEYYLDEEKVENEQFSYL